MPAAASAKRPKASQPATQSRRKPVAKAASAVADASPDERDEASIDAQLFKQLAQRMKGKPTTKEQQLLQQQLTQTATEKAAHLKQTILAEAIKTMDAGLKELDDLLASRQMQNRDNDDHLIEAALTTAENTKAALAQDADSLTAMLNSTQEALKQYEDYRSSALLELERVLTAHSRQAQSTIVQEAAVAQTPSVKLGKNRRERYSVGELLQLACHAVRPVSN